MQEKISAKVRSEWIPRNHKLYFRIEMLSCWQLRLLLIGGVLCHGIQKRTGDDPLREEQEEETHIKSDTGAAWSAPIKKLFSLLPFSLVFRLRQPFPLQSTTARGPRADSNRRSKECQTIGIIIIRPSWSNGLCFYLLPMNPLFAPSRE